MAVAYMHSQTAQLVLLDASPLCRFAECRLLAELRSYLGPRARITREVERELLLRKEPQFADLRSHLDESSDLVRSKGKWPKTTAPLPDALKLDFANLLSLKRTIGEHERAHAGEIATVLMAASREADLVVIDDSWGSGLARGRGLTVMSTARLSLEMVVAGALTEDHGFQVFDAATPEGVGRERFEQALARIRAR